VAIFIGTLFVAQAFVPGEKNDEVGFGLHLKCDFIAFYTGGSFVRDGKAADLYDITKVHAFQTEIAKQHGVNIGSAIGPWWNPPFYAWVFVPIARFPYPTALKLWVLINILCAGISAIILARIISKSRRPSLANASPQLSIQNSSLGIPSSVSTQHSVRLRSPQASFSISSALLVPALMLLSTPFIHALSHGQNACTSLLLVTIVVVCWRKEQAVLAGLVTGLLFYKPQLGAVLTAVLVLSLGWRSLIGLGITGIFLLGATLALPGSLHEFLFQMPKNLHFVQCDVPYLWDRHVTFKAFWRLLLQGTGAGEPRLAVTLLSTLCAAAVGASLLWATLRVKRASKATVNDSQGPTADRATRRDRLIAATIAATPLLMPFYFDYDQLLLAIPAVLLSADLIRRDRSLPLPKADLWLMRLWPAQYAWLMLNPDIATLTHVNLGVLLLTGVAGLLIRRAARDHESVAIAGSELTPFERRLAAA
jgi:hypothetical protein